MSEDARPTALRGVNLALRFALELCALAVLAYWGVHTHAGATGWLLGGAAVLAAAVLWGTLAAALVVVWLINLGLLRAIPR